MQHRPRQRIHLVSLLSGSQAKTAKALLPLGILYVGSYLKEHGFPVKLHHIFADEIDQTVRNIANDNPLWCGFSVLTGATTYWAYEASRKLKLASPATPVVWGGPHPSLVAEQCLREDCIDIVVHREGEETSLDLSQVLQDGDLSGLASVLGISYKDKGEIVTNPDRPLAENIDRYSVDYELIDLPQYFNIRGGNRRNITFFSSRGCPFGCAFCSTARLYGKKFRAHSHDYVINNLNSLQIKYGVNSVFFCDDNFYLIKERGREIISDMSNMGIACDCLDVRLDQLQDSDLKFFQDHKVRGVFFGWESGSDRLLTLLGKKIKVESILAKCEEIARYNIPCTGSGMMLVPTETMDETFRTIELANKLRAMLRNSSIGIMRFMPLPGTATTDMCVETGRYKPPQNPREWLAADPRESSYESPWIPWLDNKLRDKLRITQELTMSGLADYIDGSGIFNTARNLIAKSINYRLRKRNYFFLLEPAIYEYGSKIRAKLG